MALYFYFADACVACLYNYTDHILTLPCAHSVAVSGPSGNVKIAPALIRATFVARVLTPQRRGSGLNAIRNIFVPMAVETFGPEGHPLFRYLGCRIRDVSLQPLFLHFLQQRLAI